MLLFLAHYIFLTIQLHNAIQFFLLIIILVLQVISHILTSPTLLMLYLPQLCDFGFARAMSTNTVVLRSIKGKFFQLLYALYDFHK